MLDPGQWDTNIFFLWSLTYCLLLSMLCSWPGDKITVAVSKITSDSSRGAGGLQISYDWFILQTVSSSPTEGVSPGVGHVYGPLTATGPCSGISRPTQLVGKELSKFLALWLETEKWNKITVHSHGVFGCLLLPLVWRAQKTMTQRTGFVVVWVPRARIRSVQSLSRIQLFVTPWTEACQASLSITNSWRLFKLMSIKSVIPFNHLIFCRPLLLLPSIFPRSKHHGQTVLQIWGSFGRQVRPSLLYWAALGGFLPSNPHWCSGLAAPVTQLQWLMSLTPRDGQTLRWSQIIPMSWYSCYCIILSS